MSSISRNILGLEGAASFRIDTAVAGDGGGTRTSLLLGTTFETSLDGPLGLVGRRCPLQRPAARRLLSVSLS